MNRHDLTLLGALAAGSIVTPLLLVAVLDWPQWTVLPLTAAGLLLTLLCGRSIRGRRRAERLRARAAANPPRPVRSGAADEIAGRTTLREVPVPSADEGYPFLLSATVTWARAAGSDGLRVPGEADVLADAALARACAVTRTHRPAYLELSPHAVGAELGTRHTAAAGRFEAWAEDVELALTAQDEVRLRPLADAQKDREVWERQRDLEIDQREYLRRDALRTPGRAVLWQLAKDPDKVAETVDLVGALAELSAAARADDPPDRRRSGPAAVAEPADGTDRPSGHRTDHGTVSPTDHSAGRPGDRPAAHLAHAAGAGCTGTPGATEWPTADPALASDPRPELELGEVPPAAANGRGNGAGPLAHR